MLSAAALRYYHPPQRHRRGAYWYPDEGQVDNRLLVQALRQAVLDLGVTLHEGTGAIACSSARPGGASLHRSGGRL
jgi:thiazole synthase